MALDDSQNVIKIMGHATGKLADGLHFLRLSQLFFQAPLGGYVAEQAEQQQWLPVQFNK